MRSFFLVSLLGLAACATTASTDSSDDAALAAATAEAACTAPVPTGDGKLVVYATCSSLAIGQGITFLNVENGAARKFAYLPKGDEVLRVGTSGRFAYWTTRHPDRTISFSVKDTSVVPGVATKIDLGAAVGTDDVVIKAGFAAMIVQHGNPDRPQNELVVGKLDATSAAPFRQDLPDGNLKLFVSDRSASVAVAGGVLTARVAHFDLVDSPVLTDFVTPALRIPELVDGSFDGVNLVARYQNEDRTRAIAKVDVSTGNTTVIADGITAFEGFFAVDASHVWYTAKRPEGHVLELADRRANASNPARQLASDPDRIEARQTIPNGGILVTRGPLLGANDAAIVSSNGPFSETPILSRTAGKSLRIVPNVVASSPNALLEVTDLATTTQSLLLVSGSGATLGTWQQNDDYDQTKLVDLAANGGALYAERACSGGHTLLELWPTANVMQACTTGNSATRVGIPGSGALILDSGRDHTGRVLTILRP